MKTQKSVLIAYLLCIFVLGTHYAYVGKWGKQILFWLTGFGFIIGWFICLFTLPGMIKIYNLKVKLEQASNK